MTDRPAFDYNMTIMAENMIVRLYINGAPMVNHARLDTMLLTYPMTTQLRSGTNRIDVDYEPVNADLRSYTPHEGVAIQIELRQLQGVDFIGNVDLFSGKFDTEIGDITARDILVFGDTPVTTSGGAMKGPSAFSLTPVDMNYGDRQSGEFARRLSFEFTIEDETLLTLPWDNGPMLEDTPAMRRDLYDAYRELHAITDTQNAPAFLTFMEPVISRTAYILGYDDNAALMKSVWEASPFGGPEGTSIRPLLSEADVQAAHLRWGADKQMVRITPDPVAFLNADGVQVGGYRVFFCRAANGMLKPCHQMDINY